MLNVPLILTSIGRAHNFAQTSIYWHTAYMGSTKFWRPLSLTAFWIEQQTFGAHWSLWFTLNFGLQVVNLCLLYAVILALTRRRSGALVAMALIGGPLTICHNDFGEMGILPLSRQYYSTELLTLWKDQPDLWCGMFVYAAMLFVAGRRYYVALGCIVVAILFKESGWLAFPLCLAMVVARKELRFVLAPAVWASVVVGLVLAGSRVLMHLPGGYVDGRDTAWLDRFEMSVGSPVTVLIRTLHGGWVVTALGCLCGAVLFARRIVSALIAIVIGLTMLAAGVWFEAWQCRADVLTAIATMLEPSISEGAFVLCLVVALGLYGLLVKGSRNDIFTAAICYFCAVICAIPYAAAAQVKDHALVQTNAFLMMVVAYCIVSLCSGSKMRASTDTQRPDDETNKLTLSEVNVKG